MSKKNILITTSVFPYPLNSGGAQAQYHMINALRKKMQISFAYVSTNIKNETALKKEWPDVKFHPYQEQRPCWLIRKYRKKIKKLYKKIDNNRTIINPYLSHSFEGAIDYGFVRFLQQVINENNIEIIQFEFANSLNLAFAFPDIKRIYAQHEIHFIRNLRFIKDVKSLSSQDYYQFNMLKQQELTAMNACTGIITLTETDKNILNEEGVIRPIFVSPAIIPSPAEISADYKFSNSLIFIGGDQHQPNYEGIMWFLDNVWNDILKEKPQTTLFIIGKWRKRNQKMIRQTYKQVEMTGFIPSISPYSSHSIMIVPILTGSGMRMKIIEAANNGIPFVTTQVGVEGLTFENGKDCYIENTHSAFAQSTLALMNDPNTQLTFRTNAFKKIKEAYDTDKLIEQRMNVYQQI